MDDKKEEKEINNNLKKSDFKIKAIATKTKKNTKKFVSDFKKFAFKGNIIDLAVAVVIGAAFGAIVTSLVNDIIMPWISILIGDINFTDLKVVLRASDSANGIKEIAFKYGNFLQKIFEFLIIALSIFIAIKIFSKAKEKFDKNEKKEDIKQQIKVQSQTESLLTEIRDLLKENKILRAKIKNRKEKQDDKN